MICCVLTVGLDIFLYCANKIKDCIHLEKLSADEGPRKLIQPAVWEIFHRYFPEAQEFKSSDAPCEQCVVNIRTILPFFKMMFQSCYYISLEDGQRRKPDEGAQ